MKKVVIVAPFWRQSNHIGNLRVDRFRRWFREAGYDVVIVRAGSTECLKKEAWGTELTIRDPLGYYRDPSPDGAPPPPRRPSRLRQFLVPRLFNPDPGIVWAWFACRHPKVLEYAADADCIISSSPPESAHVAASRLARKLKVPHVVDLRDGWLDEPLKLLLRTSMIRRWLEGRYETSVLKHAAAVFVSSDVWKELLCERVTLETWIDATRRLF